MFIIVIWSLVRDELNLPPPPSTRSVCWLDVSPLQLLIWYWLGLLVLEAGLSVLSQDYQDAMGIWCRSAPACTARSLGELHDQGVLGDNDVANTCFLAYHLGNLGRQYRGLDHLLERGTPLAEAPEAPWLVLLSEYDLGESVTLAELRYKWFKLLPVRAYPDSCYQSEESKNWPTKCVWTMS